MLKIELETGEQFEVRYQRMTSNKVALTVWIGTSTDIKDRIAYFSWNDFTGEIGTVRVEAHVGAVGTEGKKGYIEGTNYRRRGIATGLLRIANTYMPIKHSAYRTGEGELWAISTGDDLPPLNRD